MSVTVCADQTRCSRSYQADYCAADWLLELYLQCHWNALALVKCICRTVLRHCMPVRAPHRLRTLGLRKRLLQSGLFSLLIWPEMPEGEDAAATRRTAVAWAVVASIVVQIGFGCYGIIFKPWVGLVDTLIFCLMRDTGQSPLLHPVLLPSCIHSIAAADISPTAPSATASRLLYPLHPCCCILCCCRCRCRCCCNCHPSTAPTAAAHLLPGARHWSAHQLQSASAV